MRWSGVRWGVVGKGKGGGVVERGTAWHVCTN